MAAPSQHKAKAESLKEKTVMDGYLTKLGGRGLKANWRRRWFILTYDKYLYYYKTPQVRPLKALFPSSLPLRQTFWLTFSSLPLSFSLPSCRSGSRWVRRTQDDEPTGLISLNDYEETVIDEKKKNGFNLVNNSKSTLRVFRLCADSQKECLQWIGAIEQVLKV